MVRTSKFSVRSAAVLTNSYVAGNVLGPGKTANPQGDDPSDFNQLIVLVDFTKGSSTSLEVKVEFSFDDTTYYQQTGVAYSAGTSTMVVNEYTSTSTGKFQIEIPFKSKYIKISAKCTGTVTSTSCTVDALLGVV